MVNENLYNCQLNRTHQTLGNLVDNSKVSKFTMTEILGIVIRNNPDELYKLKFINYFVDGHPTNGDKISLYNDNDEMRIILSYLFKIREISWSIFKIYTELLTLCDPHIIPSAEYTYEKLRNIKLSFRREFYSNYTINFYCHLRESLEDDLNFLCSFPPTLIRGFDSVLSNYKESGIMPVEALKEFDLNFIKNLGISISNFSKNNLDVLIKIKDIIGVNLVRDNISTILSLSMRYDYKVIAQSIKEVSEELDNSHFINNLNV